MRPAAVVVALSGVVALALPAHADPAARSESQPPPVIAIIGDAGLNPLHEAFRATSGRPPVYPPGMPRPVTVPMPSSGTFAERLAELSAGPLGSPAPDTLYALSGTRLLVYVPAGVETPLVDRAHGTATTDSAIGRVTGTAPDALAVFIAGNTPAGHRWLAKQRWIDVASISVYSVNTVDPICNNAAASRALPRNGGLLFSSAGNLIDYGEPLQYPNGLPETYQVGGVDRSGKTWLPPRPEARNPFLASGNVVRPYETGARYDFPAAAPDSITANQEFGGTSGATPTVAGYAAQLVTEARRLLGHRGGRTDRALATATDGRRLPLRGPLADGSFTRDELVDLLHRTATPAETGPHRYLLEGFGATDARSHHKALDVLAGKASVPARTDDQTWHDRVEGLRGQQAARC